MTEPRNSCGLDFTYAILRSQPYVYLLDTETMKLAQILAIAAAGGFLAADKKPADLEAAILAADASMPGNVASSKEIEDKAMAAADAKRTARDRARDSRRAAADAKRKEKRDAEDAKVLEKRAACDAKRTDDRKAMDAKMSKDRKDDPECTNDKAMAACDAAMEKEARDEDTMDAADEDYSTAGDPSTPGGNRGGEQAVDSAALVAAAVAARDDLHAARAEVAPVLGVVTMDSAADVRRAALTKLGVDASTVHDSALAGMLKMAKDKAATPAAPVTPAATTAAVNAIVPGYDRLK